MNETIRIYEQGCGYIWGTYGQIWTETLQKRGSKQNNANTQAYGSRWLDYQVYDCSGLPYAVLKQLGLSIPHGSNSIWSGFLSEKGKLSQFPESRRLPGMAVFLNRGGDRHHIGTYIGGGWVVEAYGTQTGVVISRWEKWDEAGYYRNVSYDLPADWTPSFRFNVARPPRGFQTVRKGDAGPSVRYVQVLLREKQGVQVTVDNYFGNELLTAVRSFQQQRGLTVDGVVGPLTIAALEMQEEPTQPPAAPDAGNELADWVAALRAAHQTYGQQMDALLGKADELLKPVQTK